MHCVWALQYEAEANVAIFQCIQACYKYLYTSASVVPEIGRNDLKSHGGLRRGPQSSELTVKDVSCLWCLFRDDPEYLLE